MIIFDLDGTLADCEHRRHFITKPTNCKFIYTDITPRQNGCILHGEYRTENGSKWKPDWKAFYEACDKDQPIYPVIWTLEYFGEANEFGCETQHVDYYDIEIWSGRCESVRKKTENWLAKHLEHYSQNSPVLKMRPIGDYTPDDELKERWLDEALAKGKKIHFVFDNRPKVVRMWRRRGIFVFDVNQTEKEF